METARLRDGVRAALPLALAPLLFGASFGLLAAKDLNFGSLYDLFANLFREPWVVQRFLPKITEGEAFIQFSR